MKNILFSDKTETNNSIKNNLLDFNFKSKSKKYNTNLDIFPSKKKSSRSNNNNDDNSIKLDNAYKNINLMLSSCLESIQAEDKEENIQNHFFKGVLRKNEKNSNFRSTFKDNLKEKANLNKSLSLSNSNILMKSSDDNILNNLNVEKEKKNALRLNKKKVAKSISLKSNHNVVSKSKLSLLLNKNTMSLFSPKRSQTKMQQNQQKYYSFSQKKQDFDFNRDKIMMKLENKKNRSTSKMLIVKNREKDEKEKEISKFNKSKTLILSGRNLTDKYQLSNDKKSSKKLKLSDHFSSLKNVSKYSIISELDKNSLLNKNRKKLFGRRSNTIILPTKTIQNLIKSPRKSKLKNSIKYNEKEKLTILTLNEIENKIKKTIIDFDLEKLKKDLYDFENNQFSEIINNLPKKAEENIKSNVNSKISLNTTDCKYKCMTSINNENDYLNQNTNEENDENCKKFQYKYRKLFLSKKVYDSLDDEELGDEEGINSIYLSPTSSTVYIIDLLILIYSFIQLFYLPYYLAYFHNTCKDSLISLKSLLFYSCDLIYIIDFISGFFRAYYNFEEILIRNNLDICLNYLTGWFFMDLFEAIPFYTIINLIANNCNANMNYHISYSGQNSLYYSLLIFKILKVFKVFTDNRALTRIVHFFNKNDFFYNWRSVFFTLLVSLSSIHFCSCYFIFLGKNTYPGWIVLSDLQTSEFYNIYVTAVYYLMTTLTTVGYGDISASGKYERFYQILLLIVGTCAYSWILTFISNYIKRNNEKYIDFENKIKILGEIRYNYPNLNNDLYERVLRYLNYNKSEYKYNVENILDSLPSSLKNNLIVEMYKPIIRNFHFFKYFENSDFFVKIVTSLKPILSMKDDILVQEGDFIEDIIFIKKGILTLEILIDLDSPKESAEDHLNMTGIGSVNNLSKYDTKKTVQESKCNNSVSIVSQKSNRNITKINSKFMTIEKKINNKKSMKIIDLRKNEHFGDVLMILNERSPLTVKVKSKKAELFFLQKTDATEISNQYPNIWKRIVNKSLYNMKQIKNLIQKKIIIFCELNDIWINPELKKKYLEENEINIANDIIIIDKKIGKHKSPKTKKSKYSPKKQIESIIYEEDENFDSMYNTYILSENNIKKDKKNSISSHCYSTKQLKTQIKSSDNLHLSNVSFNIQKKNGRYLSISNKNINQFNKSSLLTDENSHKSKKSNSNTDANKKEMMTNEYEDNQEKITSSKNNSVCNLNNMISMIDEKMKSSKGQINNFNINIFTPKTVQIPINQVNNNRSLSESKAISKNDIHYDKENSLGGINEEFYYDENFEINILKHDISLNNCDTNNDFIYPNSKRFPVKLKNKNLVKDLNIKKLLDNNEKEENVGNIEIINNKNIESKNISSKSNPVNKFMNLDNTKNISFAIYSIYENINKLSRYKYQKDSFLRQKTKAFIINNCCPKKNSFENSNEIREIKPKFTVSNYNSPKNKVNISSINKNYSVIYRNRGVDDVLNKNKTSKKKRFFSIDNGKIISPIKRIKTNDFSKFKKIKNSNIYRNKNIKSILSNSIIYHDGMYTNKNRNKKGSLYNTNITSENEDDKEKNFYSRVKTFRKVQKNKEREKDKEASTIGKKLNLKERISQNIEKNQQNLNNPEEYFSGFFKNILIKKKTQKNLRAFNNQKKAMNKNKKDTNVKSPAKSKNTEFDFERITHLRRNSTLNEDNSRSFRI